MTKKAKEYFENKRKMAFEDYLSNQTLLIREIWGLNDEMMKRWGDVRLLLGISNIKDVVRMRKGLTTISSQLLIISEEIKKYAEAEIKEPIEVIELN